MLKHLGELSKQPCKAPLPLLQQEKESTYYVSPKLASIASLGPRDISLISLRPRALAIGLLRVSFVADSQRLLVIARDRIQRRRW